MQRTSLFALLLVCAFLMLAPGAPFVRKLESAAPTGGAVRNLPAAFRSAGEPLPFAGVTTTHYAMGAGALAVSRECNAEFPGTRLCEWADIFRAIPPPDLGGAVLVAPSYDVNPTTSCLDADGHVRCRPGTLIPAACCGTVGGGGAGNTIGLSLSSISFQNCADVFDLTATVLGPTGEPITGVLVQFSFQGSTAGAPPVVFTPGSVTSDGLGQAGTKVSLPNSCASVCSGGNNCSGSIVATEFPDQISSPPLPVLDDIP